MRIILSDYSTSPYFNLALEEYMLKGKDDAFLLWQNADSVIIGKNQNAYAEINQKFCNENNITVARRLTGGGAVFHDIGNVNFSFVCDFDRGLDFAKYIAPICDVLKEFGINAQMNGRNDIEADGFKISGNAQCVYDTEDGRKRLLHHGTLLFDADISHMQGALNVNREKLSAKGIKSVSSRVCNIKSMASYSGPLKLKDFISDIAKSMARSLNVESEFLSEDEIAGAEKLREEKFSKWEWNFGTSPEFSKTNSKRFSYGIVEVSYTAEHGKISKAEIRGDFFGEEDVTVLSNQLVGTRLEKDDLEKGLEEVGKYISESVPGEIAELFIK